MTKSHREGDTMLAYHLSTIDVRVRKIEAAVADNPQALALLKEIKGKLAEPSSMSFSQGADNDLEWNEAYRLERLLALIEPAGNLSIELMRRAGAATDERIAAASRLTVAAQAAIAQAHDALKTSPALLGNGETVLRSQLLDTLEELHWAYQRKF
jgi:hypothetical protein